LPTIRQLFLSDYHLADCKMPLVLKANREMTNHPLLEMVLPAILVTCLFLNILGKDWHLRCIGCVGWISICVHYRAKRSRLEAARRDSVQRRMEREARDWSEKEVTQYYILAAPSKKGESTSG
jgi:hypothetical protein